MPPEKDEILPFEALTKGYVLLPKKLLEAHLNMRDSSFSYAEALLMTIVRVNYKEAIASIRGRDVPCYRGESVMSVNAWARIFHWSNGKTRVFFKKMERMGKITRTPVAYGISRLKVVDYDLWTCNTAKEMDERNTRTEELFRKFWEEYHDTTQTIRRDIGAARREWRRLSAKEKDLAGSQIYSYYMGLDDVRFCKRACNYLRDKSFLNEEID